MCLDTCHLHAAGYDLRSPAALQATLDEFEGLIGLKRVHLVHLSDCKSALGSHLDRHEHVGLGQIGEEGFRAVYHPVLSGLPMILGRRWTAVATMSAIFRRQGGLPALIRRMASLKPAERPHWIWA